MIRIVRRIPWQALWQAKWYVAVALGVAAFLLLNDGARTALRHARELGALRAELAALTRENELLKREVYYLEHDPSYIERMARRELGLLAPEEVEYRFKDKQ